MYAWGRNNICTATIICSMWQSIKTWVKMPWSIQKCLSNTLKICNHVLWLRDFYISNFLCKICCMWSCANLESIKYQDILVCRLKCLIPSRKIRWISSWLALLMGLQQTISGGPDGYFFSHQLERYILQILLPEKT